MARAINVFRCVCGARPGEAHTDRCPYPTVIVENRPELWQLPEWSPAAADDRAAHLDELLEACNRRALEAWVRAGRAI